MRLPGKTSVRPRYNPEFSHSLVIAASPARVLAAFLDRTDLHIWWNTIRAITNPTILGAYAVEWETTEFSDDLFGPLGGTFHGTVVEYKPARELCLANAYWIPPQGEPIGPMALEVRCTPHGPKEDPDRATLLHVAQRGSESTSRWTHYYDVITRGWLSSLETLKGYLEREAGH